MFLFLKSYSFLTLFLFLIITHSLASEIQTDFDKPKFLNVYGGGGGEKREGFGSFDIRMVIFPRCETIKMVRK